MNTYPQTPKYITRSVPSFLDRPKRKTLNYEMQFDSRVSKPLPFPSIHDKIENSFHTPLFTRVPSDSFRPIKNLENRPILEEFSIVPKQLNFKNI